MHFNCSKYAVWMLLTIFFSGCSLVDFFQRKPSGDEESSALGVIGDDLGEKAGGRDQAALNGVYAVARVEAPAAVRPDPDMYVRRVLRQFRTDSATLARVTGNVEVYRELMGGASRDFSTSPALTYDATSLLAQITVAEEVCRVLVAPTSWEHPGWSSVLPSGPSDADANIKYLYQRFTGLPSDSLSSEKLTALKDIMSASASSSGSNENEKYVAPCASLLVDAKAMLL